MDSRYYKQYMMAAIRGYAARNPEALPLDRSLIERDLCLLTEPECEQILGAARERGVKIHYFKRSDRMLPRVNKVLGFLKGIRFFCAGRIDRPSLGQEWHTSKKKGSMPCSTHKRKAPSSRI